MARALGNQDDVKTWSIMLLLLKRISAEARRLGEDRLKGSLRR
jgi:hypothetical protein